MYSLYPLNLFFKFISLSPHCFNRGHSHSRLQAYCADFNMNHNGVIGKLCIRFIQTLSNIFCVENVFVG